MSSKVVFYDREERIRRFGIDCGDELLWKNGTWQPGGEFCKTLVVKNVGNETIKINYKPPETAYFSMDFPEGKTLSPGMSMPVRVIFRPVKLEPYDDYIEFIVRMKKLKWSFFTPVRARLSQVAVSVPEFEDFGFAPVMEDTLRTFEVVNTGNVPAEFQWKVQAPFQIEPQRGVIDGTQRFTITFRPTEASAFVSKALFYVKNLPDSPVLFKMSGIGKFPFVNLSDKRVDFGDCFPGKMVEREVVLRNKSFVPATFSIQRREKDVFPVFSVEPTAGVIPPGETKSLKVKYNPQVAGQFSCDHVLISTPGGNSVELETSGNCVGPNVVAGRRDQSAAASKEERQVVQFGDSPIVSKLPEGKKPITRVVYITNNSPQEVRYQFLLGANGEFEFDEPEGTVPAQLEKAVTVRFRPRRVGNYYRRVFCAIRDRMPLFFDFVGTAFDPETPEKRPQPLLYRHVLAQMKREHLGWDRETPDSIIQIESDPAAQDKIANVVLLEDDDQVTCSGNSTFGELQVCEQVFRKAQDESRVISIDTDEIDFGAVSRLRASAEKQTFHVTNRHRSKMVCSWTVNVCEGDQQPPFAIFPESQDIPPGQTVQFRVLFRPGVDNLYYHATATAYVYVKANRTFRLVKDEAFVPPYCISLQLSGHTFSGGAQQFLPKANFLVHSDFMGNSDEKFVDFPVCHFGEKSYNTVVLENTGDTPVRFAFGEDPSRRFEVYPKTGFLRAGSSQIILLRCTPNSEGLHKYKMKCVLNNSVENTQVFQLACFCSLPGIQVRETDVLFSDGSSEREMFLRPTCVGLSSERTFSVKNTSRVPLLFEWKIPKRFRSVLSVSPLRGLLRGNETANIQWSFAPSASRKYEIECPLIARSSSEKSRHATQVRRSLIVHGEGTGATLTFDTEGLEMGTVLANSAVEKSVTLLNHSPGDVSFALKVSSDSEDAELSLSAVKGLIGARSSQKIQVAFLPKRCGEYRFSLQCSFGSPSHQDDKKSAELPERKTIVCHVRGSAAYPTMIVEDARSGSITTARIWNHFDISTLNRLLCSKVSDAERRYAEVCGVKPPDAENGIEAMLDLVNFRFPPTLHGSNTVSVAFQFKNVGKLPVDFRFKFPNETDIDIEPWAESKEPTQEQVRQSFLLEEKLFEVEPKVGHLAPGEATTVRLSYRPVSLEYEGDHMLEIMLCLNNGKQIRVNFYGQTLHPQSREVFLFPASQTHCLEPTRIGLLHPPVQQVEVFNPFPWPVKYQVVQDSIVEIQRANYGFPVLSCTNPLGVVPPMSYSPICFTFNPIEVKVHECEVALSVTPNMDDEGVDDVKEFVRFKLIGEAFQAKEQVEQKEEKYPGWKPPTSQLLPIPGQIASLSSDVLSFGVLIDGAKTARLTFIRNHTASTLRFTWDDEHPLVASKAIAIEPVTGTVEPGSFIICRVAACNTGEDYRVLQTNVNCLIETVVKQSVDSMSPGPLLRSPTRRSISRSSSIRFSPKSPSTRLGKSGSDTTVDSVCAQKQTLSAFLQGSFMSQKDLDGTEIETSFIPTTATTETTSSTEQDGLLENGRLRDDADVDVDVDVDDEKVGEAEPTTPRSVQLFDLLTTRAVSNSLDRVSRGETPLFLDFCRQRESKQRLHQRKQVLSSPENYDLVEAVVENSVFNLIQEAAHGEIDLTKHRTLLFPRLEDKSDSANLGNNNNNELD